MSPMWRVYKAMEVHPLGPCIIIDTAGFGDESELGKSRMEKTRLAAEKTDIALLLVAGNGDAALDEEEMHWYRFLKEHGTPVLFVVGKTDIRSDAQVDKLAAAIREKTGEEAYPVSAKTGEGMEALKEALIRKLPENYGSRLITGTLVDREDLVLLVMPQDIQAPKGRLILPQVQTLRELLDKKCLVMSCTTDKLKDTLCALANPPQLIITDSQVFHTVYEQKPAESRLTSFSVLFAGYKGDIHYYVESTFAIDRLTEQSRVLIAEACTHAPLTEDIGRVKIPHLLRKRTGEGLQIDIVSGNDFPEDLSPYNLIIHCGACMFNRKYVLSRIEQARAQQVPMTNYGVAIAHLNGILNKIVY